MLNHVTLRKHDEIRLGMMSGRWEVVGETEDGRYVLIVDRYPMVYQVIDREQGFRGALTDGQLLDRDAPDVPIFDEDNEEEEAGRILDALADGRELALSSLLPLWIEQHWTSEIRGPVINPEKLSSWAVHQVWHWLQANGCRWLMPADALVHIRGHYIETTTWTAQVRYLWPRRPIRDSYRIPIRRRRLRIRVPLDQYRKA